MGVLQTDWNRKKRTITLLRHSLVPRAFPPLPFAKGKTLVTNEVDTDLPLHNSILLSSLWRLAFFVAFFAAFFFVIEEHTFGNACLISTYNYRHYDHVMKILKQSVTNFWQDCSRHWRKREQFCYRKCVPKINVGGQTFWCEKEKELVFR